MTNAITNLCYIVNPVTIGQDWDNFSTFFFTGFQFAFIAGGVVWVALLVKSALNPPRSPRLGD